VGENVEQEGKRIYALFITHEDKPGMFGQFGTALGELGINIRENNSRFLSDCVQTVYVVHQEPTEAVRKKLMAIAGVKRVTY
jgi:D-3-phosphoglycerate dehydrogenase